METILEQSQNVELLYLKQTYCMYIRKNLAQSLERQTFFLLKNNELYNIPD